MEYMPEDVCVRLCVVLKLAKTTLTVAAIRRTLKARAGGGGE